MNLHRKQFTSLALAAIATGFWGSALAQGAYPTKTVTMVVPTAAGGTTDLSARMLAQALSPVLGQSVIVDNKGGGNGNIAASIVKRAEPDGYTVFMQYSGYHVISPHITKQKQWDQADFQPVANVISAPQIIVVRNDLPVKTLPELMAYAKANPGKLNYASSGNGSLQHVTGAMLEQQGGIKMVHVPYKGTGPALQDLLGGQLDFMFDPGIGLSHVKAGKLRLLAVGSAKRSPLFPDVPTLDEVGLKGFDADTWFGFYAPAGTPPDVVTRLNREINKVLGTQAVKDRITALGGVPAPMSPTDFNARASIDSARFGALIKARNIQGD